MVSPVKLVAVEALPVTLPAIGALTVKFPNVPTLVKLEPVTVDFKVVPVNCSADAAAAIVISALPSKATPLMVFEAANLVAVPALPVVVVAVPAVAAFPVTLPAMGLVTVKLVKVPTLVKLEPVIFDFNVVPVNCSADAAAAIVISTLPSNATPLIFLAVVE